MIEKVYVNPLLSQLSIHFAQPVVIASQLTFLCFSLGLIFYVCRRYPAVWGRPVFFYVLAFVFFYQIPSIFYGGNLYFGLPNPLGFFALVNLTPIALVLWLLVFFRHYPYGTGDIGYSQERVNNTFERNWLLLLTGLVVAIFSILLYYIPWRCSGLWALLFDPESTLLARELSMKLNNNTHVNRLYGFYANALGPVLCFFGLYFAVKYYQARNFFKCLFFFLLAFVSVVFVLAAGVKGMLLGMGIFVLVAMLSAFEGRLYRVAVFSGCLIFFGISVLAFQIALERGQFRDGHSYDFGGCAKSFGSCQKAAELVRSAAMRESGGLGLSRTRLGEYDAQLDLSCSATQTSQNAKAEAIAKKSHARVRELDLSFSATQTSQNAKAEAIAKKSHARVRDHVEALAVRLFQTPLQVAAWHFMYVADHPSPGLGAISVVGRLSGEDVSLGERVYQAYGSVYAQGDKTSTSTAPTSFLFSYSAALGFMGLFLSLLLLILLDLFAGWIVSELISPLNFAAFGLCALMAVNLISSDFFTVMFSHGGFFGLVLLYCLGKLNGSRSV